jgi:hypothetical protein
MEKTKDQGVTKMNGEQKKIEFDEICRECSGTGVFVGMCERDGAAVVCHNCQGTGKFHFVHTYQEFDTRADRMDVKRVFEVNPGVMIGTANSVKGNGISLQDFGGITYGEWRAGKGFPPGSENRRFTCPAWWYQSAGYEKKPKWNECCFGSFSLCSMFTRRGDCWKRWDKENPPTETSQKRVK